MRIYGITYETEDGVQEEDVIIQDEIFKSRARLFIFRSSSLCCFVISNVAPELFLGGNSNP